jgi:hypothetical protein
VLSGNFRDDGLLVGCGEQAVGSPDRDGGRTSDAGVKEVAAGDVGRLIRMHDEPGLSAQRLAYSVARY